MSWENNWDVSRLSKILLSFKLIMKLFNEQTVNVKLDRYERERAATCDRIEIDSRKLTRKSFDDRAECLLKIVCSGSELLVATVGTTTKTVRLSNDEEKQDLGLRKEVKKKQRRVSNLRFSLQQQLKWDRVCRQTFVKLVMTFGLQYTFRWKIIRNCISFPSLTVGKLLLNQLDFCPIFVCVSFSF